jgi:hypothetical protein
MATLKCFTIAAALLVAGTSLAVAQNGPATGGEPPVSGGATGTPANLGPPGPGVIPHDVTSPNMQSAAPATGAAARIAGARIPHRHMYLSTRGSPHKRLETGQPLPKQPRYPQ